MKKYTAILGLLLGLPGPLAAGGWQEPVFRSGFEGQEACLVFDGIDDQLIIPSITISGAFLLNGGPFPASQYDDANISLRHRQTGDVFELGNTHDLSYSVNVVPGRYDVLYSVETPGDYVPHNSDAVLQENIALGANGTLDINVTRYMIGGDMLLNGVAFPASQYDDGVIHLRGQLTGTLELAETNQQSFADVPVLPGSYEIRYSVDTPGDNVPVNTWGRAGLVSITGNNPNLDINVSSIELAGSFFHNGVLMPANELADGNFLLETVTGDRVLLGNSHAQHYSLNVMPGKYSVYWEVESPSAALPVNTRARIVGNVNVNAGSLNINMLSHEVSGDFLQNGQPFTNNVNHTAQLVLRDVIDGRETLLGYTHQGGYDLRLVAAEYDVIYKYTQGTQVPGNLFATIDRLDIRFDAVRDINVVAANFGAEVHLDGAPFPADNAQLAYVFLQNPGDSADRVLVGFTPQQVLTTRAITGIYDVYYDYQSGDQIPVNRNYRMASGAEVSALAPWPPIDGGLQLDVDSRVLHGDFFRNDASPPASQFDDGVVEMHFGGGTAAFGNTHGLGYSVRVVDPDEDAIYPLIYRNETRGDSMPVNGNAPIGCVTFDPVPF